MVGVTGSNPVRPTEPPAVAGGFLFCGWRGAGMKGWMKSYLAAGASGGKGGDEGLFGGVEVAGHAFVVAVDVVAEVEEAVVADPGGEINDEDRDGAIEPDPFFL